MLAPTELEHLAERYAREKASRECSPRAAEVRATLARVARALCAAADTVSDLDHHERAVAGFSSTEISDLLQRLEDIAARSGAGAESINRLGPNGRRRLVDYREPSPKFALVREIADRLDGIGAPLDASNDGWLHRCAREALHLADEVEPSRGLGRVVADVLAVRKNRPCAGGVHASQIAAE